MSFFAELRRRKVIRVAVVYVLVGLGVAEGADIFLPNLGLPSWSVTLILTLVIAGFPVALVIAWAYDVTPSGIVRDSPSPETGNVDEDGKPRAATSPSVTAREPERGPAGPRSIAVLPFVDMSPGGDQEYFGDGVAEEITNALTSLAGLSVAPRTSAFTLGKNGADIREIGQQLRVSTILEGSVRQAGDRLRVTAQLIDVDAGFHLWSDTYERVLEDVFAIQDEIAHAVADTLRGKLLSEDEGRLVVAPTNSLEAYDLTLRGKHHWRRRYQVGLQTALEYFQKATQIDPDYALPYTGVADTFSIFGLYGFMPAAEAAKHAMAAIDRALELQPTLPEAHFSLGMAEVTLKLDHPAAEAAWKRAIQLRPGFAEPKVWIALHAASCGHFDEGLRAAEQAVDTDPHSVYVREIAATALLWCRKYERALEASELVLELEPEAVIAAYCLAFSHGELGEHEQAMAQWDRVLAKTNRAPTFLAWSAYSFSIAGQQQRARSQVAELERLREEGRLPAALLFSGFAAIGETDEAFRWLEIAERDEGGAPQIAYAGAPLFNPVRHDERWKSRMRRMGIRYDAWES